VETRCKKAIEAIKQQLDTGDILLRKGFGLLSTLISLFFKIPYSHVGLVIKTANGIRVYDMQPGRYRPLAFSTFEKFFYGSKRLEIIFFSKFLTKQEKKCIIREVQYFYNKKPKYDYTFSRGEDKLFCLEFVYLVLKRCKLIKKFKKVYKSSKYFRMLKHFDNLLK